MFSTSWCWWQYLDVGDRIVIWLRSSKWQSYWILALKILQRKNDIVATKRPSSLPSSQTCHLHNFVTQKPSFLTALPTLARNEFNRIEKIFCFDNWTWIISKYLQFVIYTNLKSFNLKTVRWRNEIIFWKLQQILQIRKMKYSYKKRS